MEPNIRYKILSLLNEELKKVISWASSSTSSPEEDLDEFCHALNIKFGINVDEDRFIYQIRNLVNSLQDSITHNDTHINRNYMTNLALEDLIRISLFIDIDKLQELETDIFLMKRLYHINRR